MAGLIQVFGLFLPMTIPSDQDFSNCGLRKKISGSRVKLAFCASCRETENPSSAAKLFEKFMVIAHVIDKSENLRTKIDKSQLGLE